MTVKPWMTKIAALALMGVAYLVQRNLIPPGLTVLHVHVAGALTALVGFLGMVGISGPQLWPALAKALGNGALDVTKKASVLLFAAFLGLSGCAHVPTPAPDCKTAAVALLGELASALIQENWSNAIEALVTDPHGGLCAVEEGLTIISKQSADNAAASGDNLEALKAQRAKAWLASHPMP